MQQVKAVKRCKCVMNEENERERRVEDVETVEQEVPTINKDEVREALKKLRNGNLLGCCS